MFLSSFSNQFASFDNSSTISSFQIGDNSCSTIYFPHLALGSLTNRTQVYSIETGKQSWVSASPPLDELKVEYPDSDRSVLFMNENNLLVGQNEGIVAVYDLRVQQQVTRFHGCPEFPSISLSKVKDDCFLVGDTIGDIYLNDFRASNNQIKHGYSGNTGGILNFCIDENRFGALSCNSTLQMYELDGLKRDPIHTGFCGTKSNCFVLLDDEIIEGNEEEDDDWSALVEGDIHVWDNFRLPDSKINPPLIDRE